jgi:hypothetical protein
MQKRHVLRLVVLLLVVAVGVWFRSTSHVPPPATAPEAGSVVTPPAAGESAVPGGTVAHPEIGFGSPGQLIDHFDKHGAEVHAGSASEYLAMAQRLRDRPAGGDVIEATRADGTRCRFDRANGTFLAFDPDLTIRTFFRPNDGEAYFRRQLGQEH